MEGRGRCAASGSERGASRKRLNFRRWALRERYDLAREIAGPVCRPGAAAIRSLKAETLPPTGAGEEAEGGKAMAAGARPAWQVEKPVSLDAFRRENRAVMQPAFELH